MTSRLKSVSEESEELVKTNRKLFIEIEKLARQKAEIWTRLEDVQHNSAQISKEKKEFVSEKSALEVRLDKALSELKDITRERDEFKSKFEELEHDALTRLMNSPVKEATNSDGDALKFSF
jgi:predicted nuclease with TOPRIM domain